MSLQRNSQPPMALGGFAAINIKAEPSPRAPRLDKPGRPEVVGVATSAVSVMGSQHDQGRYHVRSQKAFSNQSAN